jgi:hypothetical protein
MLAIGLTLWVVLNFYARRATLGANQRNRFAVVSGVYLLLWLSLAIALGKSGVLIGRAGTLLPTITLGASIAVPLLAGALLLYRSTTLSAVVAAVPLSWLVGIQFYRIIGAVFVVLYALDLQPGEFALPAGWGDVAVGLCAPVVAYLAVRGARGWRLATTSWNALGILDLVIALTTGFLSSPSSLQTLALANPNELITTFPIVLVPLFGVPLFLVLHLAVFMRLRASPPAIARERVAVETRSAGQRG